MTNRAETGRMIGIEGIDAAGKRTQSLLLSSWLGKIDLKCKIISFPDYSTHIGKEIRAFLEGRRNYPDALKHMLFAANRWEKADELRKSLKENDFLVVNRYSESNLAYGLAKGLRFNWLINLEKGLPKTNLVVLLDVPVPQTSRRRTAPKDNFEHDYELQVATRSRYLRLARKLRWEIVDGSEEVQAVHRELCKVVSRRFGMVSIF